MLITLVTRKHWPYGACVLEPKMISFHIQIEVMFSLSGVLEIGQLCFTP